MAKPWIGRIDSSGRIVWTQPRTLHSWLLRKAGRHVVARLRLVSDASAEQLAYWFAVPVPRVAAVTGYTPDQAHALMLSCCFGVITDPATRREVPRRPSSSDLSTNEFSNLIAWVGPWARARYKITIPPPAKQIPRDLDEATT